MAIEVTKEDGDLSRERWSFSVSSGYTDRITLRLSRYAIEERASKRHKWKSTKKWDLYDERSYWSSLSREEVTIPDWVKIKARELVEIDVPDLEPRGKR